jgi:hypothetical protein
MPPFFVVMHAFRISHDVRRQISERYYCSKSLCVVVF